MLWAVGISRRQNVYRAGVGLIFPEAATGRPRKYLVPDDVAVSAGMMLADAKWKKVGWRRGTKGKLTCQFAACRIQVADGHRHCMGDGRVQAIHARNQAGHSRPLHATTTQMPSLR
ncbi:MAG: hypothetical protein ABW169_07325 [Sphingobium sp.]